MKNSNAPKMPTKPPMPECKPPKSDVEAIPVEWLLNHIPNDEVMRRYNEKLIEYLVVWWREENETDEVR